MSDHIEVSGDTTVLLRSLATVAQNMNKEFEELSCDCNNSNGHGGCHINTADGCRILGCPMVKGD